MELKPIKKEYTITEEREELMIQPNSETNPTLRIAHFLTSSNPKNQPLPKTPLHFFPSSSNNIKQLSKRFIFRGRIKSQNSWKSWVDQLQKTHESNWKKVGIFNAIKASTYKIHRDDEMIMCLAEKWCPETNTFVFSWGESTINLEDIMILGGFSVMGNSVLNPCSENKKFAEIKDELRKSYVIIRKICKNNISHKGWLEYFKGKGGEIEHVALLVMWLSRYVLGSNKFIVVTKKSVFDIAINLALGTKFALAPAVLASIYRDLAILKEEIVLENMGNLVDSSSEVFLWSQIHFVQLWAWERFPISSLKPASLVYGVPRMARWHDVMKIVSPNLRLDIDSAGDSFVWRPYVMCLKNWDVPKFYCDVGMWVEIDSELDEELVSFVRCLRACELVGLDCVMQYSPHRVGMQFGMDQDIPNFIPRFNADYEVAWSRYAKPMEGLRVYLPPRLFEGDITVQYSRWWMLSLNVDDDDVLVKYLRRKRSLRKRKNLAQLLDWGETGRFTKALICSTSKGIVLEKPLNNVVDEIAPSIALNEQEDIVADKEKRMLVDYFTFNTSLSDEREDIVAEKQKEEMVDDTPSKTAYNDQEDIAAEQSKGSNPQGMRQSTTALITEAVTEEKLDFENKKLCSVLAKDCNQYRKGTMDAIMEVKQAYHSPPIDVKEQDDSVKYIQQKSDLLESRISRLESVVSMLKLAKFGPMV